MNLMLGQTSPEDDDNTVNITISWNEVNHVNDTIINVTILFSHLTLLVLMYWTI